MWVNTSQFTVVNWNDFPDQESIYFDSYWDEINKYCREGYSVGGQTITNRHFFYLNFWHIFGLNQKTGRKTIIRPRFTELDAKRYRWLQEGFDQKKDNMWFKARQNGSSETVAGGVIGFDFTFYPASQSVIVSGEGKYATHTMNNVTRGLDMLEPTEFYKRRNPMTPNHEGMIRASFTDIVEDINGNKHKKRSGYLSEVYALSAKDNPQALSRLSPSIVVCEEYGLWQKWVAKELREFVEPSLWAEGKKTGTIIYIGTGGEMGDSVELMEEMFFNPERYNLYAIDATEYDDEAEFGTKTAVFISATDFEIMDKDGNIDKEASKASILEKRKIKKGKDLQRYITQKPLKPEEGFLISTGGFFDEDIVYMLNERRAEIMQHREISSLTKRGDLWWVFLDGTKSKWLKDMRDQIDHIEFIEEEEGDVYIYENPYIPKGALEPPWGLYKAGTDSYDRDEANTSSSKGYMCVYKGFAGIDQSSRVLVAEIFCRPKTAEMFHEMTAKLCWYYNARNLIEYSNLTIFKWYQVNGFEHLLRERPALAQAKYIMNSKVFNQHGVDSALKPYALKGLRDYASIRANIDKMQSLIQINAFIKFRLDPKYNCDVTVGSAWGMLHLTEDEDLMIGTQRSGEQIVNTKRFLRYKTNQYGQLIRV